MCDARMFAESCTGSPRRPGRTWTANHRTIARDLRGLPCNPRGPQPPLTVRRHVASREVPLSTDPAAPPAMLPESDCPRVQENEKTEHVGTRRIAQGLAPALP